EGARGVGGELLRGGDRAREELARVDDLVDEPGLAALVDAEDAAAEDDVAEVTARDAEAQDLAGDGRAGDADLECGRAKGRLAAREEAAVGGTGEDRADGDRVAVDRGDEGLLEGEELLEAGVEGGEELLEVGAAPLEHAEEVDAGGEDRARAGEDD